MLTCRECIEGLEKTAVYFRHLQAVGFFGDQPVFREHEKHCNDAIAMMKEQGTEKKCCRDCEYYGACHDE